MSAQHLQAAALQKLFINPCLSVITIDPDCMIVPPTIEASENVTEEDNVTYQDVENTPNERQSILMAIKEQMNFMLDCTTRIEEQTNYLPSVKSDLEKLNIESDMALERLEDFKYGTTGLHSKLENMMKSLITNEHDRSAIAKKINYDETIFNGDISDVFPIQNVEGLNKITVLLENTTIYKCVIEQVKFLFNSGMNQFRKVFDDECLFQMEFENNKIFDMLNEIWYNNDNESVKYFFEIEKNNARERQSSKLKIESFKPHKPRDKDFKPKRIRRKYRPISKK